MTPGKVLVRDTAGQEREAWPVDARELLATGQWSPADDAADRILEGMPAFPMLAKARTTGLQQPAAVRAPVVEGEAPKAVRGGRKVA